MLIALFFGEGNTIAMSRSVGTLSESSLHRELKLCYAGQGGQTEAEVAGFVADGKSADGEYIEIQTGSFGPLKRKARKIAAQGKLRIVYPVIVTKYIEVFTVRGRCLSRRKSNKRGCPWDLFDVLVYAPELPLVRGVAIELALVDVTERRVRDGKGSWRRKGVSIRDRQMTALHGRVCLKRPADYLCFLPFEPGEQFTTALFGEKAGIRVALARKTVYVLCRLGLVEKTGKQGNSLVYQLAPGKKKRRNQPQLPEISPKKAKRQTTT